MRLRLIKLRFRRRVRKSQRQVEDLSTQTEHHLDHHLIGRLGRLGPVKRFVSAWLLLMVLLIGGLIAQNILLSNYYQKLSPVPGGIYNEGVLGTFTNANPMYATGNADTTVSRLIFAGLFTYNNKNQLTGDLASGYSVDANGTTYTVSLRPHLTWQDGQPLTSSDVLFTYQSIQNPDAQSPLRTSWQGITITAPNPQTVVFKLQNPLVSFPYNMTNGIVPQHLLGKVPAAGLRSTDFNTAHPVGAGPFAWHDIQVAGNDPGTAQEQIALLPFADYARGKPKLQEFIVHAYANQSKLIAAFKNGQLTGVEGLTTVPPALQSMPSLQIHSPLLTAETMVFFKTTSGLLADQQVRQALVQGANTKQIIKSLGYSTHAVREPFLAGQLGYDPSLTQPGSDLKAAQQMLDKAGWVADKDGWRSKAGQPLEFTLSAANTPEYSSVTKQLQGQWKALGVKLNVELQDSADFQNTLAHHNYDAVLYGISIGADPDIFVYWDSSQADIRSSHLNLSEYKSPAADTAIEAGRTRLNPGLRAVKYKPFLEAWQKDYPALGLYQPRLLYLTNGPVSGLSDHAINNAADRLDNVQNWQIRQGKVTN